MTSNDKRLLASAKAISDHCRESDCDNCIFSAGLHYCALLDAVLPKFWDLPDIPEETRGIKNATT